ncbi:MAG: flagellar type III secretion system pore protein FliP [Firmicutes bacterium]|nr:flagellar type III secretion system pore protein FliP [Bacillota bacterium]
MKNNRVLFFVILTAITIFMAVQPAHAQPLPGIDLQIQPTDEPQQVVDSVKLLVLLSLLSLVPAFILMMTSFTRIIIVLSLLRSALGINQTPPNQVLIGLALFLTFFIMSPVYEQVNEQAIQPYLANELAQEEAWERATAPVREFMFNQTREKDLQLFVDISDTPNPEYEEDIPLSVLMPSFVISELKTAFQMGFLIYVPFLVIDMVVASTLMSMGMFMLPPVIISLPFKILLFVMVDGWHLIIKSLVESFG